MRAKVDQGAVKIDPAIKFKLKIVAAQSATSIKQLVEDALRIAGKTDPRFRFEDGGRK